MAIFVGAKLPVSCPDWRNDDFILDAARLAAEEALLDQAFISVSPDAHAEFLTLTARSDDFNDHAF